MPSPDLTREIFPDLEETRGVAGGSALRMLRTAINRTATIAGFALLAVAAGTRPADKDKIVWKPIQDAILQVDSRAPKIWNVYQPGKKVDPLLLQLGSRYLVIYVKNMEIYELQPERLEHKGESLLWRESDKPAKPLATIDWSTKDIGSAYRILVKLPEEGRLIDVQIPQTPDFRRGIY